MKRFAITMVLLAAVSLAMAGENISSSQEPTLRTATLVTGDFLRHTISLETGAPGKVMFGREVRNFDSDLDFGVYQKNSFTVGIQGGQDGAIVDCGHWRDIATEYGYQETVGGGQGFNSIRFENGELVILDDLENQTVQPFTKGNEFLDVEPGSVVSVAGRLGHVFLVHLVNRHDPLDDVVAKFLVVSGRKNDRATIIWEVLER